MKYLLVAISVLLFTGRSSAQQTIAGYPQVKIYLQSEKNNRGLLLGKRNGEIDINRFLRLIEQQQANNNPAKKRTFMDLPAIFSASPKDISASPVTRNYFIERKTPSPALEIIGAFAAPVAGALYPKYIGKIYPNTSAAEAAYLESTYHQHE